MNIYLLAGLLLGSVIVFPLLYFSFEPLGFWRASFLSAASTALFWMVFKQPTGLLNGLVLFLVFFCFFLAPAFVVGMFFYAGWTDRQDRRVRFLASSAGRRTRIVTGLVGLLFGVVILPLSLMQSPMNQRALAGGVMFIVLSSLELWFAWRESPVVAPVELERSDAR